MSIVIEFDDIVEDVINDDGDTIVATNSIFTITLSGVKVERVIKQF